MIPTAIMASSADSEAESTSAKNAESAKKPAENGLEEQAANPTTANATVPNGKAKAPKPLQQKGKPAEAPEDRKLSGKEMKEKAKAEKAARRAKEKAGQQGQPVVDLGPNKQGEKTPRKPSTAGAVPPTSEGLHKRTGSSSMNIRKGLPLRPAQHAQPIAEEPEKENKNVALFDHLYGNPRRTTIAGASKDVHPAVLALGLQMRNYVICGSSARCVAMMLAFKRVSEVSNPRRYRR